MANPDHLKRLTKGVKQWNKWRQTNRELYLDFRNADLRNRNLKGYNLSLSDFHKADLSGSDLSRTNLHGSDLSEALLKNTTLIETNLCRTDLYKSDLSKSDLINVNLKGCQLAETNLQGATINSCEIYGISAWDLKLDNSIQRDLIIFHGDSSKITVDNIEVAQFIYLLVNNEKLKGIIDTITSKAVLILGRFTKQRKEVLDAIKANLRNKNLLPIVFDFEKPESQTLTGAVETLARMSRFIIADITDPKSIPHELTKLVPHLTKTPFRTIILQGTKPYAMFIDLLDYPWVLPPYEYESKEQLLSVIDVEIILRAEEKLKELRR